MAKFTRSSLLGILSILMVGCTVIASKITFTHQKYVILLGRGDNKGVIGKVEAHTAKRGRVVYYSRKRSEYLAVDSKDGRLTLLKNLPDKAKTRSFLVEARIKNRRAKTCRVQLIVLPRNYGDRYVEQAIKVVKESPPKLIHIHLKKNSKSTSSMLESVLRELSGSLAVDISKVQTEIEMVIWTIRMKIKWRYCKTCKIFDEVHLKQLLSAKQLKYIISQFPSCKKPRVVDGCNSWSKYRTFDGTCNNLKKSLYGAADTAFIRLLGAKYFDEPDALNDPIGYPNQPNAPDVPSPFKISQNFIKDEVAHFSSESPVGTHAVMQFGQFLDHDLGLVADSEGSEHCNVSCKHTSFIPPCYPILRFGENKCTEFVRSAAVCGTADSTRQQINVNTAFVDASQVYGSTKDLATKLRGTNGLLRTSSGPGGAFLPRDQRSSHEDEPPLCADQGGCFLAGDRRVNEQASLVSTHTLLLREHNRIAKELKSLNEKWDDEIIYQETRKIVGAILQKITYKDWLTIILGPNALPKYHGYDSKVNPGISNAFATGAFRFGHSLIRQKFDVLNKNFDPVGPGAIDLPSMFFNSTVILSDGIEGLLLGLVGNATENVDRILAPGLTKHLFERENSPGMNLAALNIQRSRDHGIPGYNAFRRLCKLRNAKTFRHTRNEIRNTENRKLLKELYDDNPNLVELWVAGLAEAPTHGGMVGPTFRCLLIEQFHRTRDGDRFYYENSGVFTEDQLKEIEKSSLARLYCNNLHGIISIQEDAFRIPGVCNKRVDCSRIPRMNLTKWRATVLTFTHPKYVILLGSGQNKGLIGKVEIHNAKGEKVMYYSRDSSGYLAVDEKDGRLTLSKNLRNESRSFSVEARIKYHGRATAIVQLITLALYYGDTYVEQAIKEVKESRQKRTVLKGKTKATSLMLESILRAPRDDLAADISKVQTEIETVIWIIKRKISHSFQSKCKHCLISNEIHLKQLLSAKQLNYIISQFQPCKKPKVSRGCNRRSKYRTFDGTCNNLKKPLYGAADTAFIRLLCAKYFDEPDALNDPIGYPNQPNAPDVPSPFKISQNFIKDEVAHFSSESPVATHAVMQFGQFLDHDLGLVADSEGSEHCENSCKHTSFKPPCYPILPLGDNKCIEIVRSAAACGAADSTRQQINLNTAFVDASQVYGSTNDLASKLRSHTNGLMRTSSGPGGDFLPLDQSKNENEPPLCTDQGGCFLAGDRRVNEQASLVSTHTLLLREHNRIAKELKSLNRKWSDERIYQETKKIVGAILQKITYKDWLPIILGKNALPKYRRYNSKVNAGISNAFATGAFRFGHSLIRQKFDVLNKNFDPVGPGAIALSSMFFNNTFIMSDGIEELLLGLVGNATEKVDRILAPGLTKHLFERENSPGLNLAAMNIQRSRDHGLPGYNAFRKFCKLRNAKTFHDTRNEIRNAENRYLLKELYDDNPNLAELWVAGLAEAPTHGGMVGRTFRCLLIEQFRRTRDGDRFYYEKPRVFKKNQLKEIEKSSLARLYCDNLHGIISIQEDAFRIPDLCNPRFCCSRVPRMDLTKWRVSKRNGKKQRFTLH